MHSIDFAKESFGPARECTPQVYPWDRRADDLIDLRFTISFQPCALPVRLSAVTISTAKKLISHTRS